INKIKFIYFFFSSRRRHTRLQGDWSSDVCSSGPSTTFLCIFCTFRRSSTVAKLCWACQIRFGRKTRSATSPPSHIHGFKNSRRKGVNRRAQTTASPKNKVECLFSSASPANSPNQSHRRELPVRTILR